MSDRSRYGHYTKYRHPSDKKVTRLYGEKDDTNRWYRCWNCGWRIDSTKVSIGTGDGVEPIPYVDSTQYDREFSGDPLSIVITVGGPSGPDVTINKITADGTNAIVPLTYKPEVSSGCPFCGTKNWR